MAVNTNSTNSKLYSHKCITNPYLPGWEYIPDGEPHIFGDRLYIFGSHDRAGGTAFCQEDYVAWSTPLDDLTDWQFHGVIYRKAQDPHNKKHMKEIWAPDVCQGSDGRYYLYYCRAFSPEIGIAVCSEPAGKYEFYDYVRDEKGNIWNHDLPFDPGILYEDPEHIWLYTGFGPMPLELPDEISVETMQMREPFKDMPKEVVEKYFQQSLLLKNPSKNASCLRLSADMKTVICSTPIAPAKKYAKGTSFEEHPFFEASSIRKIKDTYYFVYSSLQGHELCYATSKYPDKDFTFRGVIISNADLGYKGNNTARAYYANNHGGIINVKDKWYIFYHRHTNKTTFSRQGCAEPIEILEDGSIPQVEITSCGLNNGPLPAQNCYSAHICCNLMGPDGAALIDQPAGLPETTPYITEEFPDSEKNQYIHNLLEGAVCGIKYLDFQGESALTMTLRGKGNIQIILDDEHNVPIGSLNCDSVGWSKCKTTFPQLYGVHAIYFKIATTESIIDFSEFLFSC